MRLQWGCVGVVLAMGLMGPAVVAQPSSAADQKAATATAVWAKLDQELDTGYTKAGDKISLVLESEVDLQDRKLPKGTRLTGTVVRSDKQGKEHANGGVVLSFDTAVLKDKSTVPVHVSIVSLGPSPSDQVEKVDVGSGDVTDASAAAARVAGEMDDPNGRASANSSTRVNGIRVTSSIKGVLLFASPDGKSSGVILEREKQQQLDLHKWTRFDVVVTPR